MIRRPPRSTQSRSSAASDVYKRQEHPSVGTLGRRPSPPPATSGGHRESPGAYCRKTLPQSSCFQERWGFYRSAAISLEPTDRIPIAPGSNYFAEVFSGNTHQETLYDPQKWLEAEMAF